MSIKSMDLVWDHSAAKGTARMVLLAIADHDGDGGAWPAVSTLARKANCSERSVQAHLATLVELGELVIHYNSGGTHRTDPKYRPNRYELTVHKAVDQSVDDHHAGVQDSSPLAVKPDVVRGAGKSVSGVQDPAPEPSLTSQEPAAASGSKSRDELKAAVRPLVVALDKTTRFDAIRFDIPIAKLEIIADLIRRHGVERLVDAAVKTTPPDRAIRRVDAFIPTWSDLRGRILTMADMPKCPVCSRPRGMCETINANLPPAERCDGAEVYRRSS